MYVGRHVYMYEYIHALITYMHAYIDMYITVM